MATADDEEPELSLHALAALQDFYVERDDQEKRFAELKQNAEHSRPLSMDSFTEDWNASQFWYDEPTATLLAQQLLDGATSETAIALVSAPSVYVQVHNLLLGTAADERPRVALLEYDDRFAACPGFICYDFNAPLKLPAELRGRFDRLLCDPPFLSDECQTKAALTVRWLTRAPVGGEDGQEGAMPRIIVCTGERMEGLVAKVYPGARTTGFVPRHAQDRLSNEFRCYANFEGDAWRWRQD